MPEEQQGQAPQEGADTTAQPGQEGQQDTTQTTDNAGQDKKESVEIPEKFKGSTPEESLQKVLTSYQELEKQLGNSQRGSSEYQNVTKELAELKSTIESFKPKEVEKESDDEYTNLQKQHLKSLGFATKEDIDKARHDAVREGEFNAELKTLESKYDGKDGQPKFVRQEIANYALENGLGTLPPDKVYGIMHHDAITDWKIKQAMKKGTAPIVTESGRNGTQQPVEKDLSKIEDQKEFKKSLLDKYNDLG